jgi:hypothetical protein
VCRLPRIRRFAEARLNRSTFDDHLQRLSPDYEPGHVLGLGLQQEDGHYLRHAYTEREANVYAIMSDVRNYACLAPEEIAALHDLNSEIMNLADRIVAIDECAVSGRALCLK